jgi:hypothetical protein
MVERIFLRDILAAQRLYEMQSSRFAVFDSSMELLISR